jgi:hypothetical protein
MKVAAKAPRLILGLAAGLSLSILAGCATMMPAEQVVEKRAMARWDALIKRDYAEAYKYLSPGYRSGVSVDHYEKSFIYKKVKWTSAKFIESKCEEKTCKVRISLGYTVYGAVPGVKAFKSREPIEESWVRSGGSWYILPEK